MQVHQSRKFGFTLIELLVVIAIIAILAAILFPVFAKVREKARQTTCVSNEKQMGLAMIQYVGDYDDTYPCYEYGPRNGHGTATDPEYDWTIMLQPYIKVGQQNGDGGGNQYTLEQGIWTCPSMPVEPVSGELENWSYRVLTDVIMVDFSDPPYNPPTDANGTILPGGYHLITMNSINDPGDKVWLDEGGLNGKACYGLAACPFQTTGENFEAVGLDVPVITNAWASNGQTPPGAHTNLADNNDNDSGGAGCWSFGGTDSTADPGLTPRYRHNGVGNFLFCDGHVKGIRKGNLSFAANVYNYPSFPDNVPVQ